MALGGPWESVGAEERMMGVALTSEMGSCWEMKVRAFDDGCNNWAEKVLMTEETLAGIQTFVFTCWGTRRRALLFLFCRHNHRFLSASFSNSGGEKSSSSHDPSLQVTENPPDFHFIRLSWFPPKVTVLLDFSWMSTRYPTFSHHTKNTCFLTSTNLASQVSGALRSQLHHQRGASSFRRLLTIQQVLCWKETDAIRCMSWMIPFHPFDRKLIHQTARKMNRLWSEGLVLLKIQFSDCWPWLWCWIREGPAALNVPSSWPYTKW